MGVHAQPTVVREIPADVVRILVDHQRVAVPEPAIDGAVVPRRDAKVEAVEPEPVPVPSFEAELVARTESAIEMPMLPGMIEVVMLITTAGIVSDPSAVIVNVGRVWMPRCVANVV